MDEAGAGGIGPGGIGPGGIGPGGIGLGDIDYSRLTNYLRRHGYQRALSVDILADRMPPEQRPLEMRKLRMLLETLL